MDHKLSRLASRQQAPVVQSTGNWMNLLPDSANLAEDAPVISDELRGIMPGAEGLADVARARPLLKQRMKKLKEWKLTSESAC